MTARRATRPLIFLLALACVVAFAGCGKSSNKPGETVREGLSTPLGGLRYTVFMTRMLNVASAEDKAYVLGGKEAPPGHALWAVFLQACNEGDRPAIASGNFYIEDSQGNRYNPQQLGRNNPFAFMPGPVAPKNCMPVRGSLAQQSPTSGAVVLFQLPNAAAENRPLTLHIGGPPDPATGKNSEARVTLDF